MALKSNEEYMNTFLFVSSNFDDIEIYPFNIDPRMIKKKMNGVSIKGADIK